jgi:hypothetical protein
MGSSTSADTVSDWICLEFGFAFGLVMVGRWRSEDEAKVHRRKAEIRDSYKVV